MTYTDGTAQVKAKPKQPTVLICASIQMKAILTICFKDFSEAKNEFDTA